MRNGFCIATCLLMSAGLSCTGGETEDPQGIGIARQEQVAPTSYFPNSRENPAYGEDINPGSVRKLEPPPLDLEYLGRQQQYLQELQKQMTQWHAANVPADEIERMQAELKLAILGD